MVVHPVHSAHERVGHRPWAGLSVQHTMRSYFGPFKPLQCALLLALMSRSGASAFMSKIVDYRQHNSHTGRTRNECSRANAGAGESGTNHRPLQIAVLVPVTGSWNIGRSIAGAIIVALDEIRNSSTGVELEYTWHDTQCSASGGLLALTGLLEKSGRPDVVIGPGCSSACESTGAAAKYCRYHGDACIAHRTAIWSGFLTAGLVIPQISWGAGSVMFIAPCVIVLDVYCCVASNLVARVLR